jgi:hypothetical protein
LFLCHIQSRDYLFVKGIGLLHL